MTGFGLKKMGGGFALLCFFALPLSLSASALTFWLFMASIHQAAEMGKWSHLFQVTIQKHVVKSLEEISMYLDPYHVHAGEAHHAVLTRLAEQSTPVTGHQTIPLIYHAIIAEPHLTPAQETNHAVLTQLAGQSTPVTGHQTIPLIYHAIIAEEHLTPAQETNHAVLTRLAEQNSLVMTTQRFALILNVGIARLPPPVGHSQGVPEKSGVLIMETWCAGHHLYQNAHHHLLHLHRRHHRHHAHPPSDVGLPQIAEYLQAVGMVKLAGAADLDHLHHLHLHSHLHLDLHNHRRQNQQDAPVNKKHLSLSL